MAYLPASLLRMTMLAAAAITIAGCQSQRFASLDSGPEPLRPAPTGQVTSAQLPPPSGPTDPSSFPPAPGAVTTDPAAAGTDVAALPTAIPAAPAGAPDLTKEQLLGSWNANAAGVSCQMILSLTKQGDNFRAASLQCPGDAANVAAWEVAGKQVVLKDRDGNVVARLYSTGAERYDGQTTGGQSISFSR